MVITYNTAKRQATLAERELDFEDAISVFRGRTLDRLDLRKDYGETRHVTFGHLGDRLLAIVWTPTREDRRIISMRKANDREQARFKLHFGS